MDALSMPGLLPASLNNNGGGFSWTWLIIIELVVVRMVISSRRAKRPLPAAPQPKDGSSSKNGSIATQRQASEHALSMSSMCWTPSAVPEPLPPSNTRHSAKRF